MYAIGDYRLVENIDELVSESDWMLDDDICVSKWGVFNDARVVKYPHAFKCNATLRGFAGVFNLPEYYPCTSDEMIREIRKRLDVLKSDARYYNEVLNVCAKENN